MAAAKAKAPPASNDVTSLQVSLPQMLDLALGTPEVGAVNLNILHNFLHVLLHQVDLRTTKVEYRGDDANRIKTMVTSLNAGPSLRLQEYSIIDASNNVTQRVTGDAAGVNADVVTDGSIRTKGTKQQIGQGKEGESETVIYVEPVVDGTTPSALAYKTLEQSVNALRQRFQTLEELASTPELIERLKGKISDPVTDVWQIINITKRLDASEQGIDKLSKMVQDLMKGDTQMMAGNEDTSVLENRLVNLEDNLENLKQIVTNLQVIADKAEEEGGEIMVGEPVTQRVSLSQLLGGIDVKQMNKDVAMLQQQVAQMLEQLHDLDKKIDSTRDELMQRSSVKEGRKETPRSADKSCTSSQPRDTPSQTPRETPSGTPRGVCTDTPKDARDDIMRGKVCSGTPKLAGKESPKDKRVEYTSRKSATDVMPCGSLEELPTIKERIGKLEAAVSELYEKMENVPTAGVSGTAELDELVSKIQGIQGDMDKLHQTADRLIDDRENREMHLNALLEQVELLKTIKADREDLEDALADKADAQAINRKVSYDQFDAACDDLAQGLEDAIGKLGKQESIWQQALDEVQREIEGKVDKIEMSPLKDFVNTRLKSLQEKVKSVAEMKQDHEAAGTKKLLKDVQCISCDKNVVMRMEESHKFKGDTLPCTSSMKPYLTYELDQVRKQHRRLPHSRNMIQFEAALQEEVKKQKSAKTDTLVKTPRDHLCNRYCGGSHTVTTPQQRVTRMGHFLTQWGPEIVQLTEGMVKGTDGKMYKSRPMPGKFDICGPSYCEDHGDEVRPLDKPPLPPQAQRKSAEKQPSVNGKRRSLIKKQPREITTEVIEEVVETPGEEEEEKHVVIADDMLSFDSPDRVVRYVNENDIED